VNLFTQHEDNLPHAYDRTRAAAEQTVLHALAAVMALEDMPLAYAAQQASDPVVSAPLSFAAMDADAVTALQQSVELLAISCTDFQPEHWDILCSLRHACTLGVCLTSTAPSGLLDTYQIQSVQLSALRSLSFNNCDVSLQPVLQHLSALTCLGTLQFRDCLEGLSALPSGVPPLPRLKRLTFSGCNLTVLPPLKHLLRLRDLNLDDNSKLRDVQLGLRGLTALTKLSMRGRTPIGKDILDVLKQLPGLREFDVRGHTWVPRNAALLGRLQHCSHAQQFKLVV
jgi:hypothetical protein